MLKLMDLLKLLAKTGADVEFHVKKGKGTMVYGKKPVEDTCKIGNFVGVKEDSVVFRPASAGPFSEPSFVFQGKRSHDREIKFYAIDFSTLKFFLQKENFDYQYKAVLEEWPQKPKPKFRLFKK